MKTGTASVRQFFLPGGPLSQVHPQFEFRAGQLDMAMAVEAALRDQKHLVVEAGTGTGKTMAYLIPALLSGKRIVVSTGTKNLQEQLFFKDIPLVEQMFGQPLRVCYMKGRSNYLCRRRLYEAEREPILNGLEEVADFQIIRDWEQETETGDRAEIARLPETSTIWGKLDARRDLCTGQKCAQFQRCFLTLMHQKAQESDLIIVNHHLFFADLALKDQQFGQVIPNYHAVIFDEAHELEEVAGQYFGVSIGNLQVDHLIRDIQGVLIRKSLSTSDTDRVLTALSESSDRFFARLPRTEGRAAFRDRDRFLEQNSQEYDSFHNHLELLRAQMRMLDEAVDELAPLFSRATELLGGLQFLMEQGGRDFVYWVERRNRAVFLQATPIEIAGLLSAKLFEQVRGAVLTSATLAVSGEFSYIEDRLGLRDPRRLIVPPHFDYPNQALLYVPPHLPDPRAPGFLDQAAREIIRLLELSQGRAFVLFTSHQQMRQVHDRVSFAIEYPVLLQGSAPRNALLNEFKQTPNCVLFATSSFWQGVDVPGDQLSCVIIDKLPFAVPSDPVVEARVTAMTESGRNAFVEYQVPQAAISLKQGFGRLIRSNKDRGVLALLDNRILRQRYGRVFFDSLPGYGFTTRIEDIENFFACSK